MNESVHFGIDCGDLGLRAAAIIDGKPLTLPLPPEAATPVVLFDPFSNISNLGVGFPGLLQSLGGSRHLSYQGREETAETLVESRLAVAFQALSGITERPVGRTALAVPAGMSQARRKALLTCARRAGFADVSLLDKCTAAALGDPGSRDRSTTALVYDLGYGDCEFALARLAKGKCRILTCGTVPRVSGEAFDALVMEAVVLALRKNRVFLGLRQLTSHQWLEFRELAEAARVSLARRPETELTLPPHLTQLKDPVRIRLRADQFGSRLRGLIDQTIECVLGAVEQNQLEPADIDALLLVGDVAKDPPVADLVGQAFGGRPKRTDEHVVATGAAWHASQALQTAAALDPSPVSGVPALPDGGSPPPPRETPALPEAAAGEFAEVIEGVPPAGPPPPDPKAGDGRPPADVPGVEAARRLWEAGKREEAEAVLDALLRDAEALRAEIRRESLTGPRLTIRQAQALVNVGQLKQAVGLAHQAYEQAPNDPDVFTGMMRIHADVGLAMNKPEEYEDAEKILLCAHGHDQTDRSIHRALAERHFLHAQAMRSLNNPSKTLEAVTRALSFDLKHPGANQLLKELSTPADTPLPGGEGGAA